MSDGPVDMPLPRTPSDRAGAPVRDRFYNRNDFLAGGFVWLVALIGYVWTLAPGVTLEDSGELLTAAAKLGVPHPPGYPIWTISAWLWSHLIPFGNIAWRINLFSAVTASIACGLGAMLVSRSGRQLCERTEFLQPLQGRRSLQLLVLASSICAGLLLAFSPVLWSQAVITEVYGLDTLLLMLALMLVYRWSFDPAQMWRLYLAAFIWGVGLTAHQTLVLLTIAFPMFIWFNDRKLGRDVLMPILVVIIGGVVYSMFTPGSLFREGAFSGTVLFAIAVGAAFWLRALWLQGPTRMGRWPQVLLLYGAVVLGLSLYSYLYFSSCTNPPMNWGHCSQWEGFRHHFSRGQYEKVHTERTILQLWGQFNMFFDDLQAQFNIVYALLALLGLFFFRDLADRDREWMKFLFVAFLCLGLGYLFLSNPAFDRQKQFTDRVYFLPCHCLYAMWVGYGLMLGLGFALVEKPQLESATIPAVVLVLLLPVASIARNWGNQEQRGHDFGYRFGYLMFNPGGGYPEMDRHAILFGGTDPGRSVPTYLIYVESPAAPGAKSHFDSCPESGTFDRRDVYIITQSALADRNYLNNIRDQYDFNRPRLDDPITLTNRSALYRALYGTAWNALGRATAYPAEPIWIPSAKDSEDAVGRYVEDFKSRAPLPGEEVDVQNGRVSVVGVAGIMAINGLLAKDIFDHNKARHTFYVEENYVIPWMYRYMEPYGTILKLNPDPVPEITPEMVARDTAYWTGLLDELDRDPKFHRDGVAQNTYARLRAAIGGLYANRHMNPEAEAAYAQAIKICPENSEGNFRLAQLYVDESRYDDAINVLAQYQKRDPYNTTIPQAIDQIKRLHADIEAIADLEKQHAAKPGDVDLGLQLAKAYATTKRVDRLDELIDQMISSPDLSPNDFLILINFNAQLNRAERVMQLLTVFTQRYPQNALGWFNLASIMSLRGDCTGGMTALAHALALDGTDQQLHQLATRDRRLANCRNTPEFQRLITGSQNLVLPGATSTPPPFKAGQ